MTGTNRWKARTSHTANSRYVDARYYAPDPSVDWLAGIMQETNTENEEVYVRRIEEICEREHLDTIFPSSDAEVYVFAKNKHRFAQRGVMCVAQDYATLAIPLDKFATNQAAKRVGFPVPYAIVPESPNEIRSFAERINPPWLVKPRCTFGGIGTKIVRRREELESTYYATARQQARPMIQEFIPGRVKESMYVVADQNASVRTFMRTDVVKNRQRVHQDSISAFRISVTSPHLEQLRALIREIGAWGGFTFQTKIDSRDGVAKLLEINPRLGKHLWTRTLAGVNEPLLLVNAARGEAVDTATNIPSGAIVFEPIEALLELPFELLDLLLYRIRTGILGRTPTDPDNPPYTLAEIGKAFATCYAPGNRKIISIYAKHLLDDPLACSLWLYACAGELVYTAGKRGK
jgi:predicted ATP-grasp superfamily ATP-dependent carboligase